MAPVFILERKKMWDIFINETSLCVCHPADVERPWEAASSGWVDWQVWNQPGEAHDAGDRAAVPERLYIAAAQRGEVTTDMSLFVCVTASQGSECVCVFVCSWLCTCWASWLLETSCRLLRPAATGGSWLKTTCCGGRSATRKVKPRFLTFPVCSSLNSQWLPQTH